MEKFYYWCVKHIALPIIRRAIKEKINPFIGYLEAEDCQRPGVNDAMSILALENNLDHKSIKMMERVLDFKPLSPLTFKDNEFGIDCCFGTRQNCRMSSIFMDSKEYFTDIDSIHWIDIEGPEEKTVKRLDISDMKIKTIKLNPYPFHGTSIVYDQETGKIFPVGSGNKIINLNNFMGLKQVYVPTLELYDSTDKKADFFCHFTVKSFIPKEFYEDYDLTDLRTRPGKDKFLWAKEIEFCKKNLDLLLSILK